MAAAFPSIEKRSTPFLLVALEAEGEEVEDVAMVEILVEVEVDVT